MSENSITVCTDSEKPKIYKCSECSEEYAESFGRVYDGFSLWGLQLARDGQYFLCGIRASAPMTVHEVKCD